MCKRVDVAVIGWVVCWLWSCWECRKTTDAIILLSYETKILMSYLLKCWWKSESCRGKGRCALKTWALWPLLRALGSVKEEVWCFGEKGSLGRQGGRCIPLVVVIGVLVWKSIVEAVSIIMSAVLELAVNDICPSICHVLMSSLCEHVLLMMCGWLGKRGVGFKG